MRDALRVLLGRAIDYAGLFPPARLPMAGALEGYAGELRSPERWLLARFVCPVARLAEVGPHLGGLLPPGPPLMLAALGTGADGVDAFLAGLAAEAAAVEEFVVLHRGRVAADQFEVSLPPELVARATCETRVIIGDKDFAGPGDALANALPHGSLTTLRNVDHFATPESFGFIDAALEFLDAIPA